MRISDWSSDVCSSDLAQRDARIGDVEDEKGPESAEMQVGAIDDEAVADAVEAVADRAAEEQRQRQHVATRLFARHPKGAGNGAAGGDRDQRPALRSDGRRGGEECGRTSRYQGARE